MALLVSSREQKILYATVAVIAFSLAFNFIISPVLKQNESLDKQIQVNTIKLSKYRRLLSQKEIIKKKFNNLALKTDLTKPQADSAMAILNELEKVAQAADIKIVDVRPQVTERSSDSYKEVTVDLRTEGDMEGYLKFIYSLENSLSLLKIKKFQLSSKTNSSVLEGDFSIFQIYASE